MKIITNDPAVDGWMYLLDGAHYTFDEAQNRWERTPLSEREFELGWESFERFNWTILTLEFVNTTYLGMEEVDGVECYTFGWNESRVEKKEIVQAAQISRSKSEIQNRLWIDKSYFLKKFETYSVINLKIESNESIIRNQTQIEKHSLKFFDYNKPVNIVLPRDPKEAIEIPLPPLILRGWESMQEARQKTLEELKRGSGRS
jgi:hypothetical protein